MAAHDDVEKVARAIYEASIPKHGRNYVPFDELDSHGYEHAYDIATLQALAAIDAMQGEGWRDIASAPFSEWVLAWLHLPKNPPASGPVIAQRCFVTKDEDPEHHPTEHLRRTVGCWWANGMYYPAGHVTHWRPLPPPPGAKP
jgi:hypothetical protein